MPLPPLPVVYVCKTCGYKKIVTIKSDALSPIDLMNLSSTCPICGSKMENKTPNILEIIKNFFK